MILIFDMAMRKCVFRGFGVFSLPLSSDLYLRCVPACLGWLAGTSRV
jgi:hypothetical protein